MSLYDFAPTISAILGFELRVTDGRVVDALVASGTTDAVVARCQAHLDAGATQVAIQPLEQGDPFGRETLGRLAPVLHG